jgi:hypothetical protein
MTRAASDATPPLRTLVALAACALASLVARTTGAADKTSLACIRAAEEGQAARDGGQLLRAREIFAACATRECPAMLRRDCTAWLEDARRQTPSIVVVARDTAGRDVVDAQVSVDGVVRLPQLDGSAIELDPGQHLVRVSLGEGARSQLPGADPQEQRILLAPGEKNRTINVTFFRPPPAPSVAPVPTPPPQAPPPAPPPQRTHGHGLPAGSYLLGGLGLAALGVFGTFGILGLTDANHLRATCVPACQSAEVDAVRTKLQVADVALGVGVVSLGIATWLGLHALSAPAPSSWDVQLAPRVGGMSGGVRVRF